MLVSKHWFLGHLRTFLLLARIWWMCLIPIFRSSLEFRSFASNKPVQAVRINVLVCLGEILEFLFEAFLFSPALYAIKKVLFAPMDRLTDLEIAR